MVSTSLLRSPLQSWHQAHGARLVESEGWEVPAAYSGMEPEIVAAKNGLALADLSSFAKIMLRGPGVAEWSQALIGDGPASEPLGVNRLEGGALACRLTADQLLVLASGPTLALSHPAGPLRCSALAMDVPFTPAQLLAFNQTSTLAGFSLIGPHVDELLRHLTHLDAPPVGSCVQTKLASVAVLLVRAQELTVPSMRIYVTWDLGEYLWQILLEAAEVLPLGLDGWRTLTAGQRS